MKLKENVIMLDSTKFSHCYLINDDGWVLIDTGLGFLGKHILKELEQMKIEPHAIKIFYLRTMTQTIQVILSSLKI